MKVSRLDQWEIKTCFECIKFEMPNYSICGDVKQTLSSQNICRFITTTAQYLGLNLFILKGKVFIFWFSLIFQHLDTQLWVWQETGEMLIFISLPSHISY